MSEYTPAAPETIPPQEQFFAELVTSAFYMRQVAENQLLGRGVEYLNQPDIGADEEPLEPSLEMVSSQDIGHDHMDWAKLYIEGSTLYLHRAARSYEDDLANNRSDGEGLRSSLYTDFQVVYRSFESSFHQIGLEVDEELRVDLIRWYGVSFILEMSLANIGDEHSWAALVSHEDWLEHEVKPRVTALKHAFRRDHRLQEFTDDQINLAYSRLKDLASSETEYDESIQWRAYASSLSLDYLFELVLGRLSSAGPMGIGFGEFLGRVEIGQAAYLCQHLIDKDSDTRSASRLLARTFSFRTPELLNKVIDNLYSMHSLPDNDPAA